MSLLHIGLDDDIIIRSQHFRSQHSFYDRFNAMSSYRLKWGLRAAYLRIQI